MKRGVFATKVSDGTIYASVPLDGSSTQLGDARRRLKDDDSAWLNDVSFIRYETIPSEVGVLPSQARFMPINFHFESSPKSPAAQERPVS
jgi:hypothetical protein